MAGESRGPAESLHVLLARAGARVVNAAAGGDPERNLAATGNLENRAHTGDGVDGGGRSRDQGADVNIEGELRKMTATLKPAAVAENAHYDFVRLGEKIAGSLESAALAQVDTAKRILEETRAEAEKLAAAMIQIAEERVAQAEKILAELRDPATGLRDQIKQVDQELADLNDRLKRFGETVLEAHRHFHGEKDVSEKS